MLAGQDLHVRRCKAWWRGVSWAVGIRRQRQVLGEHHCQGRTLSAQLYLSMWYVSSRTCIRKRTVVLTVLFYLSVLRLGVDYKPATKNCKEHQNICFKYVTVYYECAHFVVHQIFTEAQQIHYFDNLYIIRLSKTFLCFENENFLWIVCSFLRHSYLDRVDTSIEIIHIVVF